MKSFSFTGNNRGFTFVEVMVTLTILSLGIVMIFQTFIISLDRLNYLTNRLYASALLDNRISIIQRRLRVDKVLPFELNPVFPVDVGTKTVEFEQRFNLSEVEDFVDIFKLDVSLYWNEGDRKLHLSRTAYISEEK